MDIYQKILNYKKDKKLNNKDLGRLVLMSGDTFRKALSRKSLSELEIGQLEKIITNDIYKEEVIAVPDKRNCTSCRNYQNE